MIIYNLEYENQFLNIYIKYFPGYNSDIINYHGEEEDSFEILKIVDSTGERMDKDYNYIIEENCYEEILEAAQEQFLNDYDIYDNLTIRETEEDEDEYERY